MKHSPFWPVWEWDESDPEREYKGGKPSPGTPKDKRLKENQPPAKAPFPGAADPFPPAKKPKKPAGK